MGTIDNADITVYWRRAALSDNFPTGRYSDAFQKISLHRQRPWLRENARSARRRATKEIALAALANLSCAGGILFAFILCPNDQQNGFHAAKTRSFPRSKRTPVASRQLRLGEFNRAQA